MNNQNSRLVFWEDRPYLVRLPDGGDREGSPNEWDQIIGIVEEHNIDFHWSHIYTLCNNLTKRNARCRGYTSARFWNLASASHRNVLYGFRPVLVPLTPDTLEPDTEYLNTIPDGTIKTKCILVMDDKPVAVPTKLVWDGDIVYYDADSLLELSDAEHIIPWVKYPGGFVADRNLLCNISWNDLHGQGFC